ncbi:MAG: hypothetical protein J3K34DRAFT_454440 [Monoraphidium minutum]|nr:MAG: hypothetical protein J3K34DRAFT_454440 [Monoraphidium minutum]
MLRPRSLGLLLRSDRLRAPAPQRHLRRSAAPMASATAAGGGSAPQPPRHTNRLAKEQSPYLLQHAHNPVDWYPWGEEALEAARAQGKPIFLSVGYATCHWCHVMERESFEDEEAAALLNSHYIAIKVDREERPDVDRVYMTYVQALTGGGGWPMSVWLTPRLEPIYGATYLPPTDRPGMPSFSTVLRRIANIWDTRRDDLAEQAASTLEQLKDIATRGDNGGGGAEGRLPTEALAAAPLAAAEELMGRYDAARGGFGDALKFPRPAELNALLAAAAQARLSGDGARARELLGATLATLRAYCAGGMYDQLGGGFHRYSVDPYLHVPHFEKMLYDNPQLASTYLDAITAAAAAEAAGETAGAGTPAAGAAAGAPAGAEGGGGGGGGAPDWAVAAVRGTLDYLLRDMRHPGGGFYSAEDADSLDPASGEKREGAFYAWGHDEVVSVLSGAGLDPALFCEVYDVRPGGNCDRSPMSDPHREFQGRNVLIQTKRPEDAAAAAAAGLSPPAARAALAAARSALHAARTRRPRPALDDKIVTAWNGDAIGALSRAARLLRFYACPPPPSAAAGGGGAPAGGAAPTSGGGGEGRMAAEFPAEGRAPEEYLEAAAGAAAFVREQLWDGAAKRLRRSFCRAPGAVQGFASDYACLISGLLDLSEAGGGAQWLAWAAELQGVMDALFWDDARGGYFDAAEGSDPALAGLRLKEDYDGAEPAAASVAAANLARLAALLPGPPPTSAAVDGSEAGAAPAAGGGGGPGEAWYLARADAVLAAAAGRLAGPAAVAAPQMCAAAWLRARAPLRQVIISGPRGHPATAALLAAAAAAWPRDFAVAALDATSPDDAALWAARHPRALAMAEAHARKSGGAPPPTAFVCQDYTCKAPTADPGRLLALLREGGAPPAAAAAGGAARLAEMAWPPPPAAKPGGEGGA